MTGTLCMNQGTCHHYAVASPDAWAGRFFAPDVLRSCSHTILPASHGALVSWSLGERARDDVSQPGRLRNRSFRIYGLPLQMAPETVRVAKFAPFLGPVFPSISPWSPDKGYPLKSAKRTHPDLTCCYMPIATSFALKS